MASTPIREPGTPERKTILVDSRAGLALDNSQSFEVTLNEEHDAELAKRQYPNTEIRSGMSGIYNCHGLTFASRRTRIPEATTVWRAIKEDEYTWVEPKDVLPGDVVLYLSVDGDVEHSGIVVALDHLGTLPVPRICSKWGSGQERVHPVTYGPYDPSRVEYYRVRS